MKAASIKEIKSELSDLPKPELIACLLRLSKFRKENKELLTYLVYEQQDEEGYIQSIKAEIDIAFLELNIKSLYIAKKNLRRIIRLAIKYSRYSGLPATTAQVLIHVCRGILDSGLEFEKSVVIKNTYASLLKKIKEAVSALHEDLQFDFKNDLEEISR